MNLCQKEQICKNFPSKINNPWNPVFQYGCWAGHQFPARSTGMLALALPNQLRLNYISVSHDFLKLGSLFVSWSFLESKKSCSPPKSDKGKLQTYGVVQGLGKHFIAGHVGDLYRNIFKLLVMMDCLNGTYLLSETKISGLRYQVKGTLGMTNMGPFVEVHRSGPLPSYVNR